LVARAVELALAEKLVAETDLYATDDASLLDLLERSAERAKPAVARRLRSLVERYRRRKLPKRACVFPRPQNQDAQQELVERYFSLSRHAERSLAEERIADLVRFATGRDVEIMLVCPAKRMQLKEVATHVLWPGEGAVRPLAAYAERAPRLFDLERAYRDLWKFYVFADTDDAVLLARIAEIAAAHFPSATNVYRPG
jgi:hypothetical protein